MKKTEVILIAIIAFLLGICFWYIYTSQIHPVTLSQNTSQENSKIISGQFTDLQFQSLRKDGSNYYIKFSEQKEDWRAPEKCKLIHEDDIVMEEKYPECVRYGRPLQTKTPTDIDLSKEYKFNTSGSVNLINVIHGAEELISINRFYDYINKIDTPNEQYYGSVIDNPKLWGFNVTFVNGDIAVMTQVYQE